MSKNSIPGDSSPTETRTTTQTPQDRLWSALGVVYRWRRFIAGVTAGAAVLAVGISLMLPNWYAASVRVLAPEGGGGGLTSAVMRNLPSAASMLLGGPSGDYARYLTILTSRSMFVGVVDSFDLIHVYETENSRYPLENAIESLRSNVDFPVHEQYEFLSVVVFDKDPERAADMANYFVRRLNAVNSTLTSQNAGLFRSFAERRYSEASAALDSVLDARQEFQNAYGVFDLPTQTTAFFEQIGILRAKAVEGEIQYNALRAQLGDDNAQVRSMRELVTAADQQYRQALQGQEQVLPVPQERMSTVMREYIGMEREILIQSAIIEVIVPILEQARFNEEQEVQAVQVVDPAVPPAKKARPSRSLIVVVTTISIFFVSIFFVLALDWWRRSHRQFAQRMQVSIISPPAPPSRSMETARTSEP